MKRSHTDDSIPVTKSGVKMLPYKHMLYPVRFISYASNKIISNHKFNLRGRGSVRSLGIRVVSNVQHSRKRFQRFSGSCI